MISTKQKDIVEFIRRFRDENGYPPTVRDIMQACRISSTSVVAYNLKILVREGFIRRHAEVSRGIELVDSASPSVEIPLAGMIAAGKPIPVPDADAWDPAAAADKLSVPADMVQGKERVFALRVKGKSMIDALINDGDIVLVQSQNTVENGQMAAVWLKNEKEVTLKKFYAGPGQVRLQPANSQMKPLFTSPDNVEVQGRVIGVIRNLD